MFGYAAVWSVERMGEAAMDCQARVRRGQSCALDARDAVREFHAQVGQPDMALVVFFGSTQYDLDDLQARERPGDGRECAVRLPGHRAEPNNAATRADRQHADRSRRRSAGLAATVG
jgi:hypothetical protein